MIHDGVTPYPEATDSESGYNEKKILEDQSPQYQDAFGNEEGAEVKYKTMKWWYVHAMKQQPPRICANPVIGKRECVSASTALIS